MHGRGVSALPARFGQPWAWQPVVLAAGMAAANAPVLGHYLGWRAVLLYLLGCLALLAGVWALLPAQHPVWPVLLAAVALSLALQLAALHWLGPQWDDHMDRDDALALWIGALARGEYPYAVRTSLGNPISVLPFLPLLAAPFYFLGNVGYLAVAAYLCLVALLWVTYRRAQRWQVFTILMLSWAPLLFFEVVGRSDLVANLGVLVLAQLAVERHAGRPWGRSAWLLGGLIGCLAATRLALLPALGLVTLWLARSLTVRDAARVALAAAVAFAILVLPFALWEPETFFAYAPLGVNATKLGAAPWIAGAWLAATVGVTLAAGRWLTRPRQLFAASALVLALVMGATWSTFFRDLTYLQMVFVPLMFSMPRGDCQAELTPAGGADERKRPT